MTPGKGHPINYGDEFAPQLDYSREDEAEKHSREPTGPHPVDEVADDSVREDVAENGTAGQPDKAGEPQPKIVTGTVKLLGAGLLLVSGAAVVTGYAVYEHHGHAAEVREGFLGENRYDAVTSDDASNAAAEASKPLLSGGYSGEIGVASDPNGHARYIGPMPHSLEVLVARDKARNVIVVRIVGSPPFITVSSEGQYTVDTGKFTATGSGTVTSRHIPVTAKMDGTITGGILSAALTFTGTPNGPISYHIEMRKTAELPAGPLPT